MINWQVLGQLIATGTIMLAGPAVIVLLPLKLKTPILPKVPVCFPL